MSIPAGAAICLVPTEDGRIRDLVSGAFATITRAGDACIWDASCESVKCFPANRVPVVPWSNHQPGARGYAFEPWEARTNAFLETLLDDAAALATWTADANLTAALAASSHIASGFDAALAASGGTAALWRTYTATAVTRSISCYAFRDDLAAVTSADAQLCAAAGTSTPVGTLLTTTYTDVGNGVYRLRATYTGTAATWAAGIALKDGASLKVFGLQDEAGSSAGLIIPTTTVTVTRPAISISFPSTALTQASGTLVAVCRVGQAVGYKGVARWAYDSDNYVGMYTFDTLATTGFRRAATSTTDVETIASNTNYILASSWTAGAASALRLYKNGVCNSPVNNPADFAVTLGSTIDVGQLGGSLHFNSPIAALVWYPSALPAAQVLALNSLVSGVPTAGAGRKMILGLV